MSANASVKSVDELRAFSAYLKSLSANLTNEGWNDEENMKFMQEFEQTVQVINRISEHMNDYGTFIQKKCDILDLYMSTRI